MCCCMTTWAILSLKDRVWSWDPAAAAETKGKKTPVLWFLGATWEASKNEPFPPGTAPDWSLLLCPAQQEIAVCVLSLRLSFAGDLSSGVPSRGGAGLQEGSCRGQFCCEWCQGVPVEARALQEIGTGFLLVFPACCEGLLCVRALFSQSSDSSHSGWSFADL